MKVEQSRGISPPTNMAVPISMLSSLSWDPAFELLLREMPRAPKARGHGQLGKNSFSKSGFNRQRCLRIALLLCTGSRFLSHNRITQLKPRVFEDLHRLEWL